MDRQDQAQLHVTQKEIQASLQIWNLAVISLLDIRHNLITQEEAVRSYFLPASAFVFTSGMAAVSLGDTRFHSERFGLFHGGKGASLSIYPLSHWLEYYLVFYKAREPVFNRLEFCRLMEKRNPFQQQYGFSPSNPLFFADQLKRLYERFNGMTALDLFYGKGVFYQFVSEVYSELEKGNVQVLKPDTILVAVRYLEEYYGEDISIQELCQMLGISYSHFHRSFKQKTGSSPQEYLIQRRLDAALILLETTSASLREIGIRCGLLDEQGLYRLVKKKTGMSPSAYRENLYTGMRDGVLQKKSSFSYNEGGLVSLDQLKEKGAIEMFKKIRSKAVIAAASSLMLMMTACSGAPVNTGSTTGSPTTAVANQTEETKGEQPLEEGTRTIQTVMGDVEVPANPKRVVVDYVIGDVVALGVTPLAVAKAEEGGSRTAFADKITESLNINSWDMEAEEIMALEPDLIILSFSKNSYEDLSKVAPTIYVPYGEMTTHDRVRFIGDVLNKQEEAETVLNNYNDKLSKAKESIKDAGLSEATVTIGQFSDEGNYIAGAKHAAGVVAYHEMGLKVPQKIQTEIIDKDQYWGNISLEVLEPFCGDYMISLGEVSNSLQSSPVWKSIPAIQKGRLGSLDTSITWYTDIMSSSALVDLITDNLLEADK